MISVNATLAACDRGLGEAELEEVESVAREVWDTKVERLGPEAGVDARLQDLCTSCVFYV